MQKIKNRIVGCGLSGVVLAERIATLKQENVLIIDRRNHIGGNMAHIFFIQIIKKSGIT